MSLPDDRLPLTIRNARDECVRRAANARREELGAPQFLDDEPWTCPTCGTTTTPFGSVVGVRVSRLPHCPCIAAAEEEARTAWAADDLPAFIRREWERESGVPRRYVNATLDGFEPRAGAVNALEFCRRYADAFEAGATADGMVLLGPWGSGKTHLAIATARAIHDRTLARVGFTSTTDLIQRSRSLEREAIREAIGAELLILDDIGQEHLSDWARSIVYEVLDTRYKRGAPMIITTNLNTDALRDWLGGAPVSRLYECASFVPVTASDYRAEIAKRKRLA